MEERWGQKTESWTKAAPHLEKVKHQQLWDLFRELMRQSGARLNPGASGIFQPHVLLDTYSQFEKKKKKKIQWMPIFILVVQTFPCAGPVPRAFFWKGNVSLALVLTQQTLFTYALTKPPLARG